eukprot:Rmarinus@m.11988
MIWHRTILLLMSLVHATTCVCPLLKIISPQEGLVVAPVYLHAECDVNDIDPDFLVHFTATIPGALPVEVGTIPISFRKALHLSNVELLMIKGTLFHRGAPYICEGSMVSANVTIQQIEVRTVSLGLSVLPCFDRPRSNLD